MVVTKDAGTNKKIRGLTNERLYHSRREIDGVSKDPVDCKHGDVDSNIFNDLLLFNLDY